MTSDFLDWIQWEIPNSLPKKLSDTATLILDTMKFQKELLEKLGYENIAPFPDNGKWFFQKDGKFHIMDYFADKSYISYSHLSRDILLCLDNYGYHFCEPSNKNEEKSYKPKDGKYFILWGDEDNGEYTELKYLDFYNKNFSEDVFEYVKEENYLAIKYHKKKEYEKTHMSESERWIEKPRMDTIISREKDICHIEVFTYFYNDTIVVYDGDEVIVYDKEFNVLYESYSDFEIWEVNSTSYLLFPSEGMAYELSEGKQIQLISDDNIYWDYVKTYKNIAVFYNIERFQVEDNSYYDEDGNYWCDDYNEEDIPIRNTIGHIFDSSFKLLRDFNVIGEINQLKEIGDTIVMIVNSSSIDDNDTNAYYNVNVPNLTRHNNKTDEDFSVPDITFRDMTGFDNQNLVIVRVRVPSSDLIDLTKSTKTQLISEKCGVYYCVDWRKGIYKKIVECKYDYIKSLPLEDDLNIYYAGVVGLDDDNKFDLYINHKIVLEGIYFNRGHSVKLIEDGTFIQITNNDEKIGIIRNGNFIIDPIYREIKSFVQHERNYDSKTNITSESLRFLFAVSDGELWGICSPSGKLILPMKYSTIDMDDELCIVLVRDFNPELDDECDESIKEMLDYGRIYETGDYDVEKDVIVTEKANFKNGDILLDDEGDYVWNGRFIYLKEDDYSEWTDQELREAADIAYEGHSRLELGLE